MRTFYQIFIIMFVVISLFIIREDLITIYNGMVSYFLNKDINSGAITRSNSIKTGGVEEEMPSILSKIETPGPLVITDKIFNKNYSDSGLSREETINITNDIRINEQGLKGLKTNPKLNLSAEKKIDDMFSKGYFEHNSPEGLGVGDLGNQVSYEYILMGENLAMGLFKDDEDLVKAWMNSEGHRMNIINKNYTEIGVAVKYGNFKGKNVWMAVQHFGLPKTACPNVDGVLKNSITFLNTKITNMGEDLIERKKHIDDGGLYEGLTTTEQIIKYNLIVNDFNEMVKEVKDKIDLYNEQVKSFNECLSGIK